MSKEPRILSFREQLAAIRNGLAEKTTGAKPKKYLNKVSPKRQKKLDEQREAGTETGLDKYFDYHMKNSLPVCENCGLRADWLLEEKYKFLWRSCQAHVLEKKNSIGGFPSVASNLINHLVLFPHFAGLCNCHGEFDSGEEKMAKMKIFPKAVDIVNQLYPFIKADERKYLPQVFVQEIKPAIYNQ